MKNFVKNYTLLAGMIILLVLDSCTTGRKKTSQNNDDAFAYLEQQFANPDKQYGSAPLWVWNTDVTTGIIDSMMQGFKDNAFGGVFIHPRPGLITEYLSPKWFDLCNHALEKGKELGLDVWIYDENSYPSGFGGGHVPDQMPESYNQGQMLHLTKASLLPDTVDAFALVVQKEGDQFKNISTRLNEFKGKTGDYYLFSKEYFGKSPWYGGFSYVDLMAKGVTEKFIEVTMNGYEKAMGSEFGKSVPGVFSDEPQIAAQGNGNIRWTPELFAAFHQKWNYDLESNLPGLFEETGDWKKVRHDYYATLLQLFIDHWSKPYHDYTEKMHLEWTGHYWEHEWPNPNHGGDNMAMYAWHQRPAIDMLFNQFNEENPNAQFGNVRSVKELASVANQLGKKRTLSETYGGGGWELTFEDMKRLGDWEYVLGINTLNQHLSFMTIMGARKYDYPQSFSYHNPWFPYYRSLNKYFARLSLALTRGEQRNHILIIEPTTSAWMYAAYRHDDPGLAEIGQKFQSFITRLEKAQAEYDLGSENIIRDHGKVENGSFVIGERAYTTVVLPPGLENLDSNTYELLLNFVKQGGKVLGFEDIQRIDGAEDSRIKELLAKIKSIPELNDEIIQQNFTADDIAFPDLTSVGGDLYHHRRQLSDGQLLFLSNASLRESSKGRVQIKGQFALILDLLSGKMLNYPADHNGEFITINYDLFPAGSLLLFVSDKKPAGQFPSFTPTRLTGERIATEPSIIKRLKPNVLTIDFCDLKLGNTVLKDQHIYSATDTIFKHYGFPDGNPWNHSVQFKQNTVARDTFPKGTGFMATYHFHVNNGVETNDLKAVAERPELWRVLINGQEIKPLPGQWWLDKAFGVFDISQQVRVGDNQIRLIVNPMRVHAEVEPVYILGNFGLKPAAKGFDIVNETPLVIGSWKDQGMPLYGHEVAYTKTFQTSGEHKKYFVKLHDWKGTVAEVLVNDQKVGIFTSPPYVMDISSFLNREGQSKVSVVVVGSLKNTLGPHHNHTDPGLVSPWQWRNIKRYPPGSEYDVYDYGLMEDFEVFGE